MHPVLILPGSPPAFPDPRLAADGGLIAAGGDLSPERVLAAYRLGIFPWYDEDTPILWWSPDPRAVIPRTGLHVSRRLQRRIRQRRLRITWNTAFSAVVDGCGDGRPEGTWLIPEMREAYERLHAAGHAHSIEVWNGDDLVGGLYGVHVGGLFAAESMFHRETDASKVALATCFRSVIAAGVELFDVQMRTDHLASMGTTEWLRDKYLKEVRRVRDKEVDLSELEMVLE